MDSVDAMKKVEKREQHPEQSRIVRTRDLLNKIAAIRANDAHAILFSHHKGRARIVVPEGSSE